MRKGSATPKEYSRISLVLGTVALFVVGFCFATISNIYISHTTSPISHPIAIVFHNNIETWHEAKGNVEEAVEEAKGSQLNQQKRLNNVMNV